jgi:hypothetical protein
MDMYTVSLPMGRLGQIPLFNTLCGDDDLTADKDYKHVFK